MAAILRAGIIGDTGRGNYGHGLDTAYDGIQGVEVVAVADPDPAGRESAAVRTGALRQYADYREMLESESVDLVNVCPRWIGKHAEMVIEAAEAGAKGVLCEKPFAPTLSQADAMLEACGRNGVRLAVAHRRANAYEQHGKRLIESGAIGDVKSVRSRGKEDHRSGAMDLMVLGTHMMDSMRFMAGADVSWASGRVTQDGRDVTAEDIQEGDEEVGLIAGNGVDAFFAFANGVAGYFESHPGDQESDLSSRSFGFEVHGTRGIIALRSSPDGEMYLYPHSRWIPGDADGKWERIYLDEWERGPGGVTRTSQERMHLSNSMIVSELLQAIREDREVANVSSGEDARAALEMISAVHESHRTQARVGFPLRNRENPYSTWLSAGRDLCS
jgi:predicted dehydrogenase